MERSRSLWRERRDEFIVLLQLSLFRNFMQSDRSLGCFIGFGGSAQAGEYSKHCFVLGLVKEWTDILLNTFLFYLQAILVYQLLCRSSRSSVLEVAHSLTLFPCSYRGSLPRRVRVKWLIPAHTQKRSVILARGTKYQRGEHGGEQVYYGAPCR